MTANVQAKRRAASGLNYGLRGAHRPVRLSARLADARELAMNGATEADMPKPPLAETQNPANSRDAATGQNINEAALLASHRPKRQV